MKINKNFNYVGNLVDYIIDEKIKENNIIVDGTVGNGKDTLKIAKKLNNTGKIYGFDIQDLALNNTLKLFEENNVASDNLLLINDSHEYVEKYIKEEVDYAFMNLGYLPGSDKNITTKGESTIKFINSIKDLLKTEGLLTIMLYPGFEAGSNEMDLVLDYLINLDQKYYNILHINIINQINKPPQLVILEKK